MEFSYTLSIIILTAVISVLAFQSPALMQKLLLSPFLVKHSREYYRILSSGFVHANWMHLGINMFVLYMFGESVENNFKESFGSFGPIHFLGMYIGALIVSDLPTYLKHRDNSYYASLGASGAVSGVVFTSILFDPLGKLYLFGLIGIPGIIFGVLYLVYSIQMARRSQDNINHDAHFYGAIFGVIYTIAMKPSIALEFVEKLIDGIKFIN
ncbi:MAG: rhomboid family intramembrane serine protease [Bacteroidetes bacterium]|nr:rhomboid family intramembrane serine protease [Bacteroidota bacterium]